MGEGSLREAGEEGGGGGISKAGGGGGEMGKISQHLAKYFAIGKAHRGGNCYGRGREPGFRVLEAGRSDLSAPLPPR